MTRAIHSHVPGKKPWVRRKDLARKRNFCSEMMAVRRRGTGARAKFSLHVSTVTPACCLSQPNDDKSLHTPPSSSLLVMVGDDGSDILSGDRLPVGRYQPPSYWSTLSGVAKLSLYSVTFILFALFLRTFYHRFLRWRETNYRK